MSPRKKPDAHKTIANAAEAIRQLNHATLNHDYAAPEISTIVGGLVDTFARMPQLLQQLSSELQKREAEGAVRMENGQPSGPYVADVVAQLDRARHDVSRLASSTGALGEARSVLWNMGAPWPDDDE